jgi:hypothetical protein
MIAIDPNQRPWSLCFPGDLPAGTRVGDTVVIALDEWEPLTVGTATVVRITERVVRLRTDWSSLYAAPR